MKTTNKILACLNSDPSKVSKVLSKKGLKFILMNDNSKLISEKQKNKVFGFTSIISLSRNLRMLKKPPILFESVPIINQLKLSHPIEVLDGKILNNGIVHFKPLSVKKLKLVTYIFDAKTKFYIEKRSPLQFGNNSKLSKLLNTFTATIPEYIHETTYVALTSSFQEDDYTIFDNFIRENRLLTNENKSHLQELSTYIESIQDYIKMLILKDKQVSRELLRKNLGVNTKTKLTSFCKECIVKFNIPDYIEDVIFSKLAESFQNDDYSILEKYISENRGFIKSLIVDLESLHDYTIENREEIKKLVLKDKSKITEITNSKEIKNSLGRVRFLIEYFGSYNLDDYMDTEENVSTKL